MQPAPLSIIIQQNIIYDEQKIGKSETKNVIMLNVPGHPAQLSFAFIFLGLHERIFPGIP